jgi:hypothetical protein
MPENLSIGQRTQIVMDAIRLTEAGELWWEPGGDPGSFTSVRGRAVAVLERREAPERVRLWFQAVDIGGSGGKRTLTVNDAVGEVVIEHALSADDEPELKTLYKSLDKLWRMTERLAVPNAADLFLRGD